MGKVSIGLRGWRFEESDVFDESDTLRPMDEMPPDVASRVTRLSVIMGSPCNACWLLHGDDHLDECNTAAAVYGEPLAEIVVCDTHETDFRYWYQEAGGDRYRGTDEFQDAFFEWFAAGGRAPAEYDGIEHIDTDPEALPDPPRPNPQTDSASSSGPPTREIDLRETDLGRDYPSR